MNSQNRRRPLIEGAMGCLGTLVLSVLLVVLLVLLGPNSPFPPQAIQWLSYVGSWGAIIVGVVIYFVRRQ